ncbi:acyltransferase [uncultured Sulfitobacter sp.]|uniref:acyltransferase family protein n=1 Tax=uncultured Sulfitobacter sp. TaxID=191468 RepID=UPI00261753DC|nr:acyltransferase [uncultured Sulfitobacter sp.]
MTHPTTRLDAIDSARGIGIILVVFGHAWRGAFGAGLIPNNAVFAAIDAGIYAFHMPLFFFLSGLLFLETLGKYKTTALLKGRVTRLLWPMALWTWVFFGFKLLGGTAVNTPVTLTDFPLVPLPPYEHLWFLWALFLCHYFLILLYAPLPRWIPQRYWRIGAGTIGLVLAYMLPNISVPSLIWGPMVAHMPYFLIGIAIGGSDNLKRGGKFTAVLGACLFLGYIGLFMAGQPLGNPMIGSALLLIFGWMAWPHVDNGGETRVLQGLLYLGKTSMVIYLTHTIFSATLRIAMLKIEIDSLSFILLATTLIGLIAPLLVLAVARRLRLTKLLGF